MRTTLTDKIFRVADDRMFKETALEIFRFQASGCPVYSEYLSLLGIDVSTVDDILSIPFMPISFFREHTIMTGRGEPAAVFLSSGTAGMRQSRHAVRDMGIYDESLERAFRIFYGDPSGYAIMGLLPSYLEREGSSLIYMVSRLMALSGNENGGFFLDDYAGMLRSIEKSRTAGFKVLLIGVTFALLDLAERCPCDLGDVIILETGGMKGRRHEMIREELHEALTSAFGVPSVHSEYGMTELLSQAYSKGEGLFNTPPWMKVLIRDSHDPLSHTSEAGAAGGISVIDLANIYSCSFIATADLGRMHHENTFEVLGRYDDSDIRGCSLLTENGL
jgi:phenylacetate-coenzyme A ligase PaaK-like adenylate-forming protein